MSQMPDQGRSDSTAGTFEPAASANDALSSMLDLRPRKDSTASQTASQKEVQTFREAYKAESEYQSERAAPPALSLAQNTMSSSYRRPSTDSQAFSDLSRASSMSSTGKKSRWLFSRSKANKSAPCIVSSPVERTEPPTLAPFGRISALSMTNLLSDMEKNQELVPPSLFPPAEDEQEAIESPLFNRGFAAIQDQRTRPREALPKKKSGFLGMFRSSSSTAKEPKKKSKKEAKTNVKVQPFELPSMEERKALGKKESNRTRGEHEVSTRGSQALGGSPEKAQRSQHGSNGSQDLDWLARSSMLFNSSSPPRLHDPRQHERASERRPASPAFVSQPTKTKPLPVRPGVEPSSPTRSRFRRQQEAAAMYASASSSSASSSQELASSKTSSSTSPTTSEPPKWEARADRKVSGWLQRVEGIDEQQRPRSPPLTDKPLPMTGLGEPFRREQGHSRAPGSAGSDLSVLDPQFSRLPLHTTNVQVRDLLRSPTPRAEVIRTPTPGREEELIDSYGRERLETALLPPVQFASRDRHLSELSDQTMPSSVRSSTTSERSAQFATQRLPEPPRGGTTPTTQETYQASDLDTTPRRHGRSDTGEMTMASLTHTASSRESSELASPSSEVSVNDALTDARRVLAQARTARQKVADQQSYRRPELARSTASSRSSESSTGSYSAELEKSREVRERLMRKVEQKSMRASRRM